MNTFQTTIQSEMARLEHIVSQQELTYTIPLHHYEKRGTLGRKPSTYFKFLTFVRMVQMLF